jgi:outer membrane receptor protein involved in Fe transport
MRRKRRSALVLAISLAGPAAVAGAAFGQTALPEVQIKQPEKTAAPHKAKPARGTKPALAHGPAPAASPGPQTAANGATPLQAETRALDAARANILAPIGANAANLSEAAIAAQPQGADTPIEKTLLQTPGFSQDSAASGALHLRNEHANVQYRINGVLLPDGVSGFSQMLDSGFIGNVEVIDGALPAQYGLHTAGVVDITSKSGAFDGGGAVSLYGGSRGVISPSLEYGGTVGQTQYYVIGRYFGSNEGIENPAPTVNAIHDHTDQGKFFGYTSTLLGDGSRLSVISGVSIGDYQIPDNSGQPIQFPVPPGATPIDSSQVNERQYEQSFYNVAAWQKSTGALDMQLSAFSRYSSLHFVPDEVGDLEFNGVASDIFRSSFLNGVQGDAALRVNADHTLRFGFTASGEQAEADNSSIVFPTDAFGAVNGPPYAAPEIAEAKTGWLFGVYAQDEWRVTDKLTLNAGLRFDQMVEYVDANQLSPRLSATYKATDSTTFHAGYARYFTPPELALAAPTNLAAYAGTTQQPAVNLDDPVQPERSNVFDAGVDQKILPGLTAGLDAYYKTATDLLDDGQFGQAMVLTAFNYAKGWNEGVEGKLRYDSGGLSLYGNVAWGHQYATDVVSNQYLFGTMAEYEYAETHYIPTDHSQTWTGSAGASYLWNGTRLSADMIFGSGLRSGFDNSTTVPAYSQINLGVSHAFQWSPTAKPLTVRFDVVNLLDSIYEIRDGTGIGVFAPQYGPRRGFYLSLSQAL